MQPSDLRLLIGIRQTAARLALHLETPATREYASTIDVVLQELMNRQDTRRLQVQAEAGRAIFDRAHAILTDNHADDDGSHSSISTLDEAVATRHWLDAISAEMAALTPIAEALCAIDSEEVRQLLRDIVAWEADIATPADAVLALGTETAEAFSATRETLQAYLRTKWADTEVTAFRRLPGGYSKITILFETQDRENGRRALVLRGEQSGTPFFMDGADVSREFPALRYAFSHGVPVAEPLWLEEDGTILGGRFIVSRMASGSNYGDVFGSSTALDEATIRELVSVLAALHRVPLDRDDPAFRASHMAKWAQYRTVRDFAGPYVEYWARIAQKCLVVSPAITRGFAWLRANLPQDDSPTVMCHGDYGLHNVMIDGGRVSAILDWEGSYVGDPADEFFLFSIVMSSFVDPDQLMRWYVEAGGQPISEYRRRFFAVLGCLKGPLVGYGALNLAEQDQDSDIKICLVGLKYVALQLNALNDAIAAAEAARGT